MPSNFAAVTTSPRKGRDVGARHEALGSDAMRSGKGIGRRSGRDRLREAGREAGSGWEPGSGKGEGRGERGGWVKKENVVDRLSTVKVSYPRVDCNSG